MLTLAAATLSLSMFSLLALRKVALVHGLVDRPTRRKAHRGEVPFIGGISLFITILGISFIEPQLIPFQTEYLYCGFLLVSIGTIDDKLDISASSRLCILIGISLWLVLYQGIALNHLGDLFGSGDLEIGRGNIILTTIAIIGCITAFNMVDGIDGLLGGLASITFIGLAYLFYLSGETQLFYFCILFVLAMLPYILCNLELIPKKSFKVFMGDSGSFFIGFTIIWLLMESSQNLAPETHQYTLQPVTALWLIAIPLMDMAMVMIRRIRKRQSPFKPDRMHLHHICQRLGLSSRGTLFFIVCLALVHMAIGVYAQNSNVSEHLMFILFLISFICYVTTMTYIWKITSFFRKHIKPKYRNINEQP